VGGWAPAQERQRQVSSFYAIFKSLFMTLLLLYLSIWSEEGARRRRLRRDLGKEAQMGTDDSARGTAGSTVSRIMVNRVRRGASSEGKAHECLLQPHEISYKYMCRSVLTRPFGWCFKAALFHAHMCTPTVHVKMDWPSGGHALHSRAPSCRPSLSFLPFQLQTSPSRFHCQPLNPKP